MKRTSRILIWFVASATLFQTLTCQQLVINNLVAGARDGLITTVTGLITGAFDVLLNLGAMGGNGNALFIRI